AALAAQALIAGEHTADPAAAGGGRTRSAGGHAAFMSRTRDPRPATRARQAEQRVPARQSALPRGSPTATLGGLPERRMIDPKVPLALTFDDVLLLPAESNVLPRQVDVSAQLTRNLRLKIPLVSAAMDTVTEARTAIAMAQEGGLGFIHKNFSIQQQALEVTKVKKYESGMVVDPVTIEPDAPVHKAVALMRQHEISGIPVTKNGRLVGILTNRDLRFEKNLDQKVEAMMTRELVTCREGISQEEAKELLHRNRIEKLLVVDDRYELKGLITIKDIEKTRAHPNAAKDDKGRLLVGAAVGVGPERDERVHALLGAGCDVIAVDTAHGHSRGVIDAVRDLKRNFRGIEIVAGNEESPGDVILFQGRSYKSYRGMGSLGAMKLGSKDRYFQADAEDLKLVPEGIEGRVPYKGPLAMNVFQLVGGLRSGMGYTGCRSIDELRSKAKFVRITAAGLRESHVHDVQVTQEAPNYRVET